MTMNNEPQSPGPEDKLRVLSVEDSMLMREAISSILSTDFDLKLTGNLFEFNVVVKSFKPHIVLLDINLPDGNGIDACRMLRQDNLFSETVIIMLTSSDDKGTIEKGYSAGADDFIRKPVIPLELKSKVQIFSRIISHRAKIRSSYYSVLSLNRKLSTFHDIVKENISIRNIEDSLKSASMLESIITAGYIETVQFSGGTFNTLYSKTFRPDTPFKRFSDICGRISNCLVPNPRPVKMKMNTKGIDIFMVLLPLVSADTLYGYVLFENDDTFSEDDMKIINLFANFYSIIHNRFSIERTIEKINNGYKSEVSKVRKIQVSLLPDFHSLDGYDIASSYLPAQDISGDFFDAFYLDKNNYQIILCDVSGHGIASSFIGNQIRSLVKTAASAMMPPGMLARFINESIISDLKGLYYFATAIICRIDMESGKITLSNAGHPPALLYRAKTGKCELIGSNGSLIGLFPDCQYGNYEFTMEEDDVLLLYTDGVTEAASASPGPKNTDLMYGETRLKDNLQENASYASRDIIHSVIGSLYEFTEYSDQDDDITVICIKKTTS